MFGCETRQILLFMPVNLMREIFLFTFPPFFVCGRMFEPAVVVLTTASSFVSEHYKFFSFNVLLS